jgi:hypothetical protein
MSVRIFKGKLCSYFCDECHSPLPGITVELYAATEKPEIVFHQLASDPKNTLATINDKERAANKKKPIGTGVTAIDGSFEISINPDSKYNGEPVEIHTIIDAIPGAPEHAPKTAPVHVYITTVQPMWLKGKTKILHAAWEYCLPSKFWCQILKKFDMWVICGRVTTCDKINPLPLAGVKVTAFDADWLADDTLGSAVTDGSGHFKIFYTSADFKQTPFSPQINIEWTGGPDVYFKIVTADGIVLLEEPRSKGRTSTREDIENCFCVKLCVDMKDRPTCVECTNPWFTHVGDFNINSDIDPANGKTRYAVLNHGGPNFAFFGDMKLHGYCPKNDPVNNQPMRYRFLIENLSHPGTTTPITGDMVAPVVVGARIIQWNIDGSGPVPTFQSVHIRGSGATPAVPPHPTVPLGTPWGPIPAHVIVPDSEGWVNVDSMALDGGFYGPLMGFHSPKAVPGGAAPGNGAGNPPASPKNGTDMRITFEAGPVTQPATFSNSLPRIHINNWHEVRELALDQIGTGCGKVTDTLDIRYTIDHEMLADWSLGIRSGGGTVNFTQQSGTGPRGANGHDVITGMNNNPNWPSCSYIVTLTSRLALTNGNYDDTHNTTQLTFCR